MSDYIYIQNNRDARIKCQCLLNSDDLFFFIKRDYRHGSLQKNKLKQKPFDLS